MKIYTEKDSGGFYNWKFHLEVGAEELELLTNALAVYVIHETDLLRELKGKGVEPGDDSLGDMIGGTLGATVKLRQEIVAQLGFDPTDG